MGHSHAPTHPDCHRIQQTVIVCAAVCLTAASLASADRAWATPLTLTLSAEDLTTSQVFTSVFTDAGTPNSINVGAGSTGAIVFTGETAVSTVAPPLNTLITNALTVTNTSSDPYRMTASLAGLNFNGPDQYIALTGSGTWFGSAGSVMNLAFYDDPTDAGLTTPAQLVGSFTSDPALGPTSSYSYSPGTTSLSVPNPDLFSMTETWTYTLAPGGELVSRGQTETTEVPEPALNTVFGCGLIGLVLTARRRNSKPARYAGACRTESVPSQYERETMRSVIIIC
jgi:hypothetical protein